MKRHTTSSIVLAAAAMSVFVGCDMLSPTNLDETPPHIMAGETMYTDVAGFQLGLNGLYSRVRLEKQQSVRAHQSAGALFMLGTDNYVTNQSNPGIADLMQEWGVLNNPSHVAYEFVFAWLYEVINAANTLIAAADREDVEIDWSGGGSSPEVNKNIIVAEATALRAWAYRHLTYGWGDVPLTLVPSRGPTTDWTRTPVDEVRAQIVSDLMFAEEHVPVEPVQQGRISKGAIQHYLAEMHLAMDEPEEALAWADEAINTPEYQLVTERYGVRASEPGVPFMDMFYDGNTNRDQGNTESLWTFQFGYDVPGSGLNIMRGEHLTRYWNINVDGVNPIRVTQRRGGQGFGRGSITNWALDLYEPDDDRFSEYAVRQFFVLKDEVANAPFPADRLPPGYAYGDTLWLDLDLDITPENRATAFYPYSRKPEGANPNNVLSGGSHDVVYVRLADTYLLKAEAQFRLSDPDGAAETINILRRRSNASEVTAGDIDLAFILDERSRELFLEEHRRWTLLRTGTWLERTRAHNNNGGQFITERDALFPIPQSVIDTNLDLAMPQNPGY